MRKDLTLIKKILYYVEDWEGEAGSGIPVPTFSEYDSDLVEDHLLFCEETDFLSCTKVLYRC